MLEGSGPTVGGATSGLVTLGCIRKLAEQASKLQFPLPGGLWTIRLKNQFFHQLLLDLLFYLSNKKQTKTFHLWWFAMAVHPAQDTDTYVILEYHMLKNWPISLAPKMIISWYVLLANICNRLMQNTKLRPLLRRSVCWMVHLLLKIKSLQENTWPILYLKFEVMSCVWAWFPV